ncbi:MAG: molecular chaperone HtpG [Janthinobacterium lividum]
MAQETLSFQAEVKQLLKLMIHSLYSNKEIFLRELISNASDAADKLRFEALANPSLLENDADLKISVAFDKAARTLSISDNGIGLSRDEAIANLGTIARSGTREFFQNLSGDQQKDAALIGQFGVGFYSAFIVADRVSVESRRAGLPAAEGVRWESQGDGEFTIETIERASRGTTITLHLREGEDELLSTWRLKSIIQKYSDHIALPILMPKEEWDEEKKEMVLRDEQETVNQASALWTRSRNDITDTQYQEFYRHLAHDNELPLAWTHNRVEGRSEYTQLLYLPAHAPFDLYDRGQRGGLKLYVKRVFIMEDAEQLLPAYLRFLRGVVDSNDLPLNVSREILQESRDVKAIREGVTKRALSMLEDLARKEKEGPTTAAADAAAQDAPADEVLAEKGVPEHEKYPLFWSEFGQVLKEGIGEDTPNRERIAKLLRFASTHSDTSAQTVSFEDYVARMKEDQTQIFYVSADSWQAARNSPHLEVFRKKGLEVLLLSERVDEWMLSFLTEFEGKPIVSVARGDLNLPEDASEKETREKTSETLGPLIAAMKEALQDKAKEVRVSARLTDSPSCLVVDEGEMSGHLQRLLKAAGQKAPDARPVLEINAEHPLIARLTPDSPRLNDWSHLLFDQALLAEGGTLEDPASYVRRTNTLLTEQL